VSDGAGGVSICAICRRMTEAEASIAFSARKIQGPGNSIQRNTNHQSARQLNALCLVLKLGGSLELGAWILVLHL
jgi:hypothetical protein